MMVRLKVVNSLHDVGVSGVHPPMWVKYRGHGTGGSGKNLGYPVPLSSMIVNI